MIKDSGDRTEFSSGAVRDMHEGKGRCDLLPLDVVANLTLYEELKFIHHFKEANDVDCLYAALRVFL